MCELVCEDFFGWKVYSLDYDPSNGGLFPKGKALYIIDAYPYEKIDRRGRRRGSCESSHPHHGWIPDLVLTDSHGYMHSDFCPAHVELYVDSTKNSSDHYIHGEYLFKKDFELTVHYKKIMLGEE